MSALILGGLVLYALTRPRVSHAALTSLGVVTDTEYLTLTPAAAGPAVEITSVEVVDYSPVPGSYARIKVYLKANVESPILGDFCRIIDDDTGVVVGRKREYYFVAPGDTWAAYFDRGIIDWTMTMPNRVWNLRIEAGTN